MSKFWFDLPYSLAMAVLIAIMATMIQLWVLKRQSKRESKKLQIRVARGIIKFLQKEYPHLILEEDIQPEKHTIRVIEKYRGADSLGLRDILRIEINFLEEEQPPIFVRYYPSQAGGWFGTNKADTFLLIENLRAHIKYQSSNRS